MTWRAIPHRFAGAFVLVAMGAVGFLPLFGGPGYEHALATGLLVPSAAAISVALHVLGARDHGRARRAGSDERQHASVPGPLASVGRGIAVGGAFASLALAISLVHAARVGICELWGALLYYLLTAGVGCIMGGVWGAVVGEAVSAMNRRGRIVGSRACRAAAVVFAIGGPLGCAAVSVWRFITSPMIFAFDPFVGYFSGTLYDTVIDAGTTLLTYRLGSLATVVAVVVFASLLERHADRPFGLVLVLRSAGARSRAAVGVGCTLASAAMIVFGARLGHFSTTQSIIADLGKEKHGARCDVVYPKTTREQEALLLVKDCDEELGAVEARLGAKGPARVRAFFFRDAEDKKRLMGAANTYIAKPWREEVYLQVAAYPHPVLGHELAHVVAGSFGRGPFRIAGSAGGIVPNPGLIEGVAVAASPHDEDLSDAQWARAMMDIGILPSMQRVFSLGFLGDSSAKSYTLAGSFVTWVGERFGLSIVRAWYGGADITSLTSLSWASLDAEFQAHLRALPLAPDAQAFARAKFARPGLFGRKCPHVVDELRREADICRDTQRYEDAVRLYREASTKDALDFASKKELANVMRRHGDREKGRAALTELATADDAAVPRTFRDRAEEALADAEAIDGNWEAAATRYEALAARSLDEDAARTLEIKAIGGRDPEARAAIRALLLGDETHGPDIFVAGVDLGLWEAKGESGLAGYLIGRNAMGRGFYEIAARSFDAALARGLPTPRVHRETLRQRAIAACALGDDQALTRVVAQIESATDPFASATTGRRASTLRMIERCRRYRE